MESSSHAVEGRLHAVEARPAAVEGGAASLHELRRAGARNELRLHRLLHRLSVDDVTDNEVDQALATDRPRRTATGERCSELQR